MLAFVYDPAFTPEFTIPRTGLAPPELVMGRDAETERIGGVVELMVRIRP
jgi:hypothetical protein